MRAAYKNFLRTALFCLLALLFSISFAQTTPPDDDDDGFISLLVSLIPACDAPTVAVTPSGSLSLTTACTGSPTAYEWRKDNVIVAQTTVPTLATSMPLASMAAVTYSVTASNGSLQSSPVSVTINGASINISSSTLPSTPGNVSVAGTVVGGNQAYALRAYVNGLEVGTATSANGAFFMPLSLTQPGVYLTQIVATDAQGFPSWRTTTTVIAETPNATGINIATITSTAGATAGSFGVSDMGAAQYSIPITLPPGIAGMQPGLALAYSSQSGNGHVGVGWTLSGLSAITRCPKTIAQEGYREGINYDDLTTNDIYCIDGQKLIMVSTRSSTNAQGQAITITEYRTEIDRFDRIEGYEIVNDTDIRGIRNFRAFTKSGQTLDFGSRWWTLNVGYLQNAIDPTRLNTVRLWTLDKVTDRYGNYYVVDYQGKRVGAATPALRTASRIAPIGAFPAGENYPTQITYTLNDQSGASVTQVNRAVFEYEDRPDVDRHVMFDSGAGQFTLSKRLKSIAVYLDGTVPPQTGYTAACAGSECGTLVRRYTLSYDVSATTRSILRAVQECSADGVCLPATTFDWSSFTKNMLGTGSGPISVGGADLSQYNEFTVADLNGDGRSDLIRRYGSNPGHIQAFIALPGGGFEERRLYAQAGTEVAGPTDTRLSVMDLNGDGKADFFSVNNATSYMRICITNDSATGVTCSSPTDQGIPGPTDGVYLQGDFDGDGKIDLLLFRGSGMNGTDAVFKWDLLLGTSTGLSVTPIRVYTPQRSLYNNGTGVFDPQYAMVGDFNGDGRADILMRKVPDKCQADTELGSAPCIPNNQIFSWQVFLSTPDLTTGTSFAWAPKEVNLESTQFRRKYQTTVDFNGDGIADVITQDRMICLSGGDGSFGSYETVAPNPPNGYTSASLCKTARGDVTGTSNIPAEWSTEPFEKIIFGDFDGDGRTDMMIKKSNFTANVCLSRTASATNPPTGNNVYFDCSDWQLATNDSFDNIKAGDFNGDGKTDLVSSNNGVGMLLSFAGDATGSPSTRVLPDLLTKITNGLTANTSVTYAPITDPSVYTKGTSVLSANQVHIQSPMYVVKTTKSSNGLGGTFDTAYKYEALIGQTDGRGLLGFGKKIVEHNNGAATIRTETQYEQVWWKAGRINHVAKFVDSVLVNDAVNAYGCQSPSRGACVEPTPGVGLTAANIRQVHLVSTTERSWNLTAAGVAQALPYTITTTPLSQIDEYGNVSSVIVASYEPNGSPDGYGKVTTNVYTNNIANWVLGRLTSASVMHNAPGASVMRTSSFTYDATTGQLISETVEPGGAQNLQLSKTYIYDVYGNARRVTSNFYDSGVLKSRFADTFFTTDGRFVQSVVNQYNHTETRIYDRRFGAPLIVTGPNGIRSETAYDAMGRKVGESVYNASNNLLVRSTMNYIAQSGGYQVESRSHTGGYSIATYDSLGRETTVSSITFAGGMATAATGYDSYGRKTTITRPRGGATSGGAVADSWLTGTYEYDKLARPVTEVLRNGASAGSAEIARTSTAYNVLLDAGTRMATTVTQTGAQFNGAAANQVVSKYTDSQGRTTKIVDNANQTTAYTYDPLGNLTNVAGPGSIAETMTYDLRGRKISATNLNINGSNYTYTYNGAGELISQTDPKGQTTTQLYDDLGRMISRTENGANGFTTTWSYDSCGSNTKGKLCVVSNGDGGNGSASPIKGATHTSVYDAQSRPIRVTSQIDGKSYDRHTLYNAQGQVSYIGYPHMEATITGITALYQGQSVRYAYNAYGYLTQSQDGTDGTVTFNVLSRYSDGSLARATHAGAPLERDFDVLGRMTRNQLNTTAGSLLQQGLVSYDQLGNILSRSHTSATAAQSFSEAFCYDTLSRVVSVVSGTTPSCTGQFSYSPDGNLISKGGTTGNIGSITYGNTSRPGGAGPHAVSVANGKTHVYDTNGNFTAYSDNSRTITYTPFNLPAFMTGTNSNIPGINASIGNSLSYDYDGEHSRIKEIASSVSGITATTYIGSSTFERISNPDGSIDFKHYLPGPDGIAGVYTRRVIASVSGSGSNSVTTLNTTSTSRYWYKDHLGSPLAEFDANAASPGAANLTALGFDTWGLRRKTTGTSAPNSFTASLTATDLDSYASPRGYTGHQHQDEIGLIHMNGRIYDPMIGRFLQPDPIIQEPYNSQNFNRYSYVLNNPLVYTDPSGYSTWTSIRRPIAAIVVAVVAQWAAGAMMTAYADAFGETAFTIASETGTVVSTAGNGVAAAAGGFAGGGVGGGNIESAFAGAFSAFALFGVGEGLGHTDAGMFQGNHVARIFAHATIGCVASGVQGGKCGVGAASAGFAAFAGPLINTGSYAGDLAGHAVAGGIGAQLGGGKFGNGALTGAFGYLFNLAATSVQEGGELTYKGGLPPDGPGRPLGEMATELAIDVVKLVTPGAAAFECFSSSCGLIGWGIAAVDAVPAGKIVGSPLKLLHKTLNKDTLNFIRKQETGDILKSLKPGSGAEQLIVKTDGTVMQGNHRIQVLRERGVAVEKLPRVSYP